MKDNALAELQPLTDYDFESDVDVNILGHIFEQSITDIEEIKYNIEAALVTEGLSPQLRSQETISVDDGISPQLQDKQSPKKYDKKTGKRKKDGIYYTPEYITKYIVENAVGGWLEDRKKELGYYELPELPENYTYSRTGRSNRETNGRSNRGLQPSAISKSEKNVVQKHFEFWTAYKERLMNIKVLDPACGSGAFLNQAFNFLYAEGQKVNNELTLLSQGQGELFGLDKHILSNNLYGVDLNRESIEITRLSLWIKTANQHSELTALDRNIKCGNSLIDDPAVAGDKAFDWNKEFPEIFREKELKAYHVTWVTHNSRVSERMIEVHAETGEPVILTDEMRRITVEAIEEKISEEKLRVINLNVLLDHVHILIVCSADELQEIVRKLKGYSSFKICRELKLIMHHMHTD